MDPQETILPLEDGNPYSYRSEAFMPLWRWHHHWLHVSGPLYSLTHTGKIIMENIFIFIIQWDDAFLTASDKFCWGIMHCYDEIYWDGAKGCGCYRNTACTEGFYPWKWGKEPFFVKLTAAFFLKDCDNEWRPQKGFCFFVFFRIKRCWLMGSHQECLPLSCAAPSVLAFETEDRDWACASQGHCLGSIPTSPSLGHIGEWSWTASGISPTHEGEIKNEQWAKRGFTYGVIQRVLANCLLTSKINIKYSCLFLWWILLAIFCLDIQ